MFSFQRVIPLTLLSLAFLAASPPSWAECAGPLCHAMHTMQDDLDCLTGDGFNCDSNDATAQEFQDSIKQARELLKAKLSASDPKVKEIDELFDELTSAVADLAKAQAAQDPKAIQAATDRIAAARKKGHLDFKKGPILGPHTP